MTSPPSEPSVLQPAVSVDFDTPDVNKQLQAPSTSSAPADAFGDDSSSYRPPGWKFDRYTQATGLQLHTLPDDQFSKLQAGLLNVLGDEGVSRLNDHLYKLARQRAGIQLPYPDWLKYLRDFHAGQTWGFVAIQTACFDDQHRWAAFKAKLDEIVWASSLHVAGATETQQHLLQAKPNFEIRWVEDAAMALGEDGQGDGPSLETLKKRFKQATTEEHPLPNAICKQVFLVISEDSIASVMDASVSTIARFHDPDTAQSTKSKRRGSNGIIDPPYVLAVAADEPRELDEDEDGHGWFKPIFKVALELLATDFWHELDLQTNRNGESLMKLTRFTKGVDSRGASLDEREGAGNAEDQDVWWGTLVPPSQRAKRRRGV